MLDNASGRPRTGSMLNKGRDSHPSAVPDSPPDDSQSLARKLRAQLHGTRRSSLLFRFDTWLSGAFPSSLRPWLLTVPSLSTFLIAYGLFSVVVFSRYISSGISARFSHSLTSSQGAFCAFVTCSSMIAYSGNNRCLSVCGSLGRPSHVQGLVSASCLA